MASMIDTSASSNGLSSTSASYHSSCAGSAGAGSTHVPSSHTPTSSSAGSQMANAGGGSQMANVGGGSQMTNAGGGSSSAMPLPSSLPPIPPPPPMLPLANTSPFTATNGVASMTHSASTLPGNSAPFTSANGVASLAHPTSTLPGPMPAHFSPGALFAQGHGVKSEFGEFQPTDTNMADHASYIGTRSRRSSSSAHLDKKPWQGAPSHDTSPPGAPWGSRRRARMSPSRCPLCGKVFSSTDSMKRHIQMHTEKRFECGFCEKGYVTGFNLRQHVKKVHPHVEWNFECPFPACTATFYSETHLQRHRERCKYGSEHVKRRYRLESQSKAADTNANAGQNLGTAPSTNLSMPHSQPPVAAQDAYARSSRAAVPSRRDNHRGGDSRRRSSDHHRASYSRDRSYSRNRDTDYFDADRHRSRRRSQRELDDADRRPRRRSYEREYAYDSRRRLSLESVADDFPHLSESDQVTIARANGRMPTSGRALSTSMEFDEPRRNGTLSRNSSLASSPPPPPPPPHSELPAGKDDERRKNGAPTGLSAVLERSQSLPSRDPVGLPGLAQSLLQLSRAAEHSQSQREKEKRPGAAEDRGSRSRSGSDGDDARFSLRARENAELLRLMSAAQSCITASQRKIESQTSSSLCDRCGNPCSDRVSVPPVKDDTMPDTGNDIEAMRNSSRPEEERNKTESELTQAELSSSQLDQAPSTMSLSAQVKLLNKEYELANLKKDHCEVQSQLFDTQKDLCVSQKEVLALRNEVMTLREQVRELGGQAQAYSTRQAASSQHLTDAEGPSASLKPTSDQSPSSGAYSKSSPALQDATETFDGSSGIPSPQESSIKLKHSSPAGDVPQGTGSTPVLSRSSSPELTPSFSSTNDRDATPMSNASAPASQNEFETTSTAFASPSAPVIQNGHDTTSMAVSSPSTPVIQNGCHTTEKPSASPLTRAKTRVAESSSMSSSTSPSVALNSSGREEMQTTISSPHLTPEVCGAESACNAPVPDAISSTCELRNGCSASGTSEHAVLNGVGESAAANSSNKLRGTNLVRKTRSSSRSDASPPCGDLSVEQATKARGKRARPKRPCGNFAQNTPLNSNASLLSSQSNGTSKSNDSDSGAPAPKKRKFSVKHAVGDCLFLSKC